MLALHLAKHVLRAVERAHQVCEDERKQLCAEEQGKVDDCRDPPPERVPCKAQAQRQKEAAILFCAVCRDG